LAGLSFDGLARNDQTGQTLYCLREEALANAAISVYPLSKKSEIASPDKPVGIAKTLGEKPH